MNTSINELETMTESEKRYRCWERIEEMHLSYGDFKAALNDKWGMLVNQGGNH